MAISLVGTTAAASSATATTLTSTLPAGVQSGDLIIVVWTENTLNSITTAPSGYTAAISRLIDGNLTVDVYYKIAGASESAPSLVVNTATNFIHQLGVYRGVDTSTPFIAQNGQIEAGNTSTTVHSAPSITNTDANAWAVAAFCLRAVATPATWTPGTGLTERQDTDRGLATSANIAAEFCDSNGTVATGAATYSGTSSGGTATAGMWAGFMKPLVAAAAGPVRPWTMSQAVGRASNW